MASEADACRALAVEVLTKALADAVATINAHDGDSANRPSREDRREARAFCMSLDGEWAEARADWCDAAGIEPSAFLAHARKVILASERAKAAKTMRLDGAR